MTFVEAFVENFYQFCRLQFGTGPRKELHQPLPFLIFEFQNAGLLLGQYKNFFFDLYGLGTAKSHHRTGIDGTADNGDL